MVDTEEYESDQEQVLSLQAEMQSDLYAFSACRGPSDKDKVLVLVDRVPLQMLPDTGASVTIIDRSSYDKLCQTGAYPLFKTDARIFAYGSDNPLKFKGYFNAQVSVKGLLLSLTLEHNTVSKVLPASVRLIGSGSHKLVFDASLCCFYFRSQPGRFTYSVGNVSDRASEFKGRHNMVCQILACLVEMYNSCGEINMMISVLVYVGV